MSLALPMSGPCIRGSTVVGVGKSDDTEIDKILFRVCFNRAGVQSRDEFGEYPTTEHHHVNALK